MNPSELTLWILGAVFTALLAIVMLVLRSILQQGRDTNEKITGQGQTLAALSVSVEEVRRVDEKVERVDGKVDQLATQVAELRGAQGAVTEIVKAFAEALKPAVPSRRRGDT